MPRRRRDPVLGLTWSDLRLGEDYESVRSRILASLIFRAFLDSRISLFSGIEGFGGLVEGLSHIRRVVEQCDACLRRCAIGDLDPIGLERDCLAEFRQSLDEVVSECGPFGCGIEGIDDLAMKFWDEAARMVERYQDALKSSSEDRNFCRPRWLLEVEEELELERI